MPLNEAAAIRRNRLTNKQKHEALAAIYGIKENEQTMTQQQFSPEEIARMRQVLATVDAGVRKGIETFDLNSPPKAPYVHQEYPRLMYRADKTKVAHSAEDVEAAEAKGWSKTPTPVASEDDEIQSEVATEQPRKAKKAT